MSAQLSLTDEQFPVDEELGRGSLTTSVSDLATEARQIAQVTVYLCVWYFENLSLQSVILINMFLNFESLDWFYENIKQHSKL